MSLFVVTDMDEMGEGLFIMAARDEGEVRRKHARAVPDTKIISIEKMDWISLAYVSGKRGEGMYARRPKRCQ